MRLRVATGAGVAERWRKQYEREPGVWSTQPTWSTDITPRAVYDQLVALGPIPTPEAVAALIGNKSWSFCQCYSCDQYVRVVVEYGEADKIGLCRTCLLAGTAAIEAVVTWRNEL